MALPPGLGWTPPGASRSPRDPPRALARLVRGPVSTPPDSSGLVYDERWSARRPLAVVEALDALDVRAALRWAGETGTPLAVRSGGHSYGGWSTVGGGVVLDLRRLRGVHVAGRTVTAGPGVRLWELYAGLARHGATVPAGSCPTVGLGGLALGGGMGLAGRALGLTCDRVRALDVVTPDGALRRCDARTEPELFWALRGGGGAFGVVTRFELEAAPARRASAFTASWPAGAAAEALAAWQAWAPHTADGLTSMLSLGANGQVSALGQHLGPEAMLQRLVAPLRRAGAAVATSTAGYLDLQRRWAGCLDPACTLPRSRFAATSAYLSRPLDGAGRDALAALLRRGGGAGTRMLLLDAYGGAIRRAGRDASAFAHRDAECCVQALAYYAPGQEAAADAWIADARRTLAPHASGAYPNYADPGMRDWRRAYWGEHDDRLAALKARVDPGRVLRMPQLAGT